MDNLYDIKIENIDGETVTLKQYKDQVLLIVNVASRCGFTKQYAQLESLYRELHERGFSVLGFPCNQFLHQEPGDNTDIKEFATSCYNVTFPLFAKLNVKGKEQSPLYQYLEKNIIKAPRFKFIPWNFTKILIDAHGDVLKRYPPTTAISVIRRDIEKLLPTHY